MQRPHVLGALILWLATILPAGAEDKMRLWQHWEAGKTYHFEHSIDSEFMPLPGEANGSTQSANYRFDMTVTREAGSERKLVNFGFTSVKVINAVGGKITTYDSENKDASDPSLKYFGSIVGRITTLVYDKDDTFVDAIAPWASEGPQKFDPKALGADLLRELGFTLPRQEVALGETFHFDNIIAFDPTSPAVYKWKGHVDSVIEHERRKQPMIIMTGSLIVDKVSPLPTAEIHVETLFDLARRCVDRTTIKEETRAPADAGYRGYKRTYVTILKSIEEAPEEKDGK